MRRVRTPGSLLIPETRAEDMEGGHEACRVTRASGEIAEFHSTTLVTHVNHSGPGYLKSRLRGSQCS